VTRIGWVARLLASWPLTPARAVEIIAGRPATG